jgi:ferredoxin-type protein NapH
MRQKVRRTLNLIGFLLLPVIMIYFSPVMSIKGASEGIIPGSYISFACLFIISLLVGRVFCAWLCPLGGLGDALSCIHNKKTPGGKFNFIKFGIWILWILVIAIVAYKAGGYTRIDPFFQTQNKISLYNVHSYRAFYIILSLITLLAIIAGKRAFCHYVCWISPFMIMGRTISNLIRAPRLKLKVKAEACKSCLKCNSVCPMSLDVENMVTKKKIENSECILCGECVDNCPQNAISYSYSNTK